MPASRKTPLRVLRGHDVPPDGYQRSIMVTLMRVFWRWNDASASLVRQHGITLPQFEVLMALNSGEGISQQDLTERLMLTKGNICIIMQKMEASGLIDRRTDPVDQRFHRLYMTDAGRLLIATVIPDHRNLTSRIFAHMGQADQKSVYQLLSKMDQALDDLEE
jgi:DNA-binding MarR family transcriptional regulator